jgi:large subunit ribosomal protein L7/L12
MLAGVGSAPAGGAQKAAEAPKAAEPEKPKEAFNIKIGAADAKAKIKIIKEVRSITGLGLKEAKELVEKAPVVIKEGVKKEEAEQFKKLLTEAGATVELL